MYTKHIDKKKYVLRSINLNSQKEIESQLNNFITSKSLPTLYRNSITLPSPLPLLLSSKNLFCLVGTHGIRDCLWYYRVRIFNDQLSHSVIQYVIECATLLNYCKNLWWHLLSVWVFFSDTPFLKRSKVFFIKKNLRDEIA